MIPFVLSSRIINKNKCLFVIRSLRKEGYTQNEIDHLYNSIVLSKIMHGLHVPVYAASASDLKRPSHGKLKLANSC